VRRGREGAEVEERGIEVEEFDGARADAGLGAGGGDDERDADGMFEEGVFVPPAALAKVVAVVAEEDDDCLLI
jgi:hypothetical protein